MTAPAPAATSYDDVLYPVGAFDHTHPSRLATLATLFGMKPAPVERCRVLEIGCGAGGNLLPLADTLPGSSFHGIDLAARPIAEGRAWAAQLGLGNLVLEQADILDFAPEPGSFDYIIAHGVYSWVPPAVQQAVLALFQRALAPHGIAYLSYNTLPGSYARRILRDMVAFHTRNIEDPLRRVAQARALTSFIAEGIPASNDLHKRLVSGQRDRLAKLADAYVLHDDFAEHNEALYFHELIGRAAGHGLAYVSEAVFADMAVQTYPPAVREMLRGVDDLIMHEQYLDFLSGRAFRRTLLCREGVELRRQLGGDSVRPFHLLGNLTPVSESPDVHSAAVERFTNSAGLTVGLDSPRAKAALVILWESAPRALSFDELLAAVRARVGAGDDDDGELGELILATFSGDMVQLHSHRPPAASRPGERPRATALARLQAERGRAITSLWHKNVTMTGPLQRRLLSLLDGARDRATLAETLATLAEAEGIQVEREGTSVTEPAERRRAVAELIEPMLEEMARLALIEG